MKRRDLPEFGHLHYRQFGADIVREIRISFLELKASRKVVYMARIRRRFHFWHFQVHRRRSLRDTVDVVNRFPVVLKYAKYGPDIVRYQGSHFWPFQGHRSLFGGDRATLANWNY